MTVELGLPGGPIGLRGEAGPNDGPAIGSPSPQEAGDGPAVRVDLQLQPPVVQRARRDAQRRLRRGRLARTHQQPGGPEGRHILDPDGETTVLEPL